jgi:hypothetical protein
MGFITSLILMFCFGWFNSYLYRKYLRKRNKDWIVFLAIIFISGFWIIDTLIYFDVLNISWINFLPWVNFSSTEPGKYFMWNSFIVLGLDFGIIYQPGMDIIALFLFISYVFWYYFGSKMGKIFHGYRTYQQGHYLIYRPVKRFIKDREERILKEQQK